MRSTLDIRDAEAVAAALGDAADAMLASPLRHGSAVRLPGRGRLLVTGDLHDNPIHLAKIIDAAQLEASPDHHVVLHELIHGDKLINGMDFSHRVLARIAELVARFPQQVHPLLANHELAQMTGRAISKGAGNSVLQFSRALEFVFGDEAETVAEAIARFIGAMPLALVTESGVLCAHSLPGTAAMRLFDPDVLDRPLLPADYETPGGSAYLMVWGRGHSQEHVDALAGQWGVRLFCIGHEHVETGIELRLPSVLVLNSDHDRGAVVSLDLSQPPDAEALLMQAVPLSALAAKDQAS